MVDKEAESEDAICAWMKKCSSWRQTQKPFWTKDRKSLQSATTETNTAFETFQGTYVTTYKSNRTKFSFQLSEDCLRVWN